MSCSNSATLVVLSARVVLGPGDAADWFAPGRSASGSARPPPAQARETRAAISRPASGPRASRPNRAPTVPPQTSVLGCVIPDDRTETPVTGFTHGMAERFTPVGPGGLRHSGLGWAGVRCRAAARVGWCRAAGPGGVVSRGGPGGRGAPLRGRHNAPGRVSPSVKERQWCTSWAVAADVNRRRRTSCGGHCATRTRPAAGPGWSCATTRYRPGWWRATRRRCSYGRRCGRTDRWTGSAST